MTFWQAIQSGFNNYAKFSGRARPSEFWYWMLFTFIATLVTATLDNVLFASMTALSPFCDTFTVLTIVPGIAVSIRRLHDTDRSGWWFLLSFVPFVGIFVLIVWWIKQGTAGDNRFGADPFRAGGFVSQRPTI